MGMSLIKPLPSQVLKIIDHFLHNVQHGFLLLTFQDGCVTKVERTEKFVITAKSRQSGNGIVEKPLAKNPLRAKIVGEMQGMRYGQVVIRLEYGQVEQIEKTEKKRPHELPGIDSDGI